MWKSKKLILVLVLAALLVAGGTTGAVLAVDGDGTQAATQKQTMLDRLAAIYEEKTGVAIDPEELKAALAQAKSEIQDQAVEKLLQNLADKGKITQDEANQLVAWWLTKPDVGPQGPVARGIGLGLLGGAIDSSKLETILKNLADKGKITQDEAGQLLTWYQARPDVDLPAPEGKGCGRVDGGKLGRGKMGAQGFRGPMMGGKGMMGGPNTPEISEG